MPAAARPGAWERARLEPGTAVPACPSGGPGVALVSLQRAPRSAGPASQTGAAREGGTDTDMSRIDRAINIDDLKRIARRRLPKIMFDFIEGGVEDEVGLRTNANAFRDLRLVPRYYVD